MKIGQIVYHLHQAYEFPKTIVVDGEERQFDAVGAVAKDLHTNIKRGAHPHMPPKELVKTLPRVYTVEGYNGYGEVAVPLFTPGDNTEKAKWYIDQHFEIPPAQTIKVLGKPQRVDNVDVLARHIGKEIDNGRMKLDDIRQLQGDLKVPYESGTKVSVPLYRRVDVRV